MTRTKDRTQTIVVNRRAFYDYFILERLEAGLILTGTEIKSVRSGRLDIRSAYINHQNGELWLLNAHITLYSDGGIYNHDPKRPRKLLLHRDQIDRFIVNLTRKGLTGVALEVYIRNRVAKVTLGLARGKKKYDKRHVIAEREAEREMRRSVRRPK